MWWTIVTHLIAAVSGAGIGGLSVWAKLKTLAKEVKADVSKL